MGRLFHPLLFFLAKCTRHELIRQIEFLRAENEIESWSSLHRVNFFSIGDHERTGQTAEDRFVGVAGVVGIAYAEITYTYISTADVLEIDHVQYGRLAVPEPSTSKLWIAPALTSVALCRCRQPARYTAGHGGRSQRDSPI